MLAQAKISLEMFPALYSNSLQKQAKRILDWLLGGSVIYCVFLIVFLRYYIVFPVMEMHQSMQMLKYATVQHLCG